MEEKLEKLEKEKEGLEKVKYGFENKFNKIKEFVFNSKSLLIAGQLHEKLENLLTALENDSVKIYVPEVYEANDIFKISFTEIEVYKLFYKYYRIIILNKFIKNSFKKIFYIVLFQESKKDELDAFFNSYDPEQLMRGLPLDKQKYVDDLILTEEKFYKEGIMVPEVAMGQFVNDVKKIIGIFFNP